MELLDILEKQKLYRNCLMVWNDWNTEVMILQESQLYQQKATCR